MNKKIREHYVKWNRFKKARKMNEYFSCEDSSFISMFNRERLIDFLFKEIQRMKNV